MKTCLILLSLLVAGAAVAVPAWTWVDASGQRHYSDRPVAGAKQIELREAQSIPAQQPASAPGGADAASAGESSQAAAKPYTQFDVSAPTQQQTLWNIGGSLNVEVQVAPSLRAGDHIDAYLDGQLVNVNATGPQFTLPNVYRGIHTLQAVIVDGKGDEVLRSLAVTFMVQQTSILNPNNPNARPRPPSGQN